MTSNDKSNSVVNIFDNMTNEYVEYFDNDWEFINEINDFALQFNKGSTILDLGCGSGYITNYLCDLDMNAIGIDFSKEMIKIAKTKYPKLNFLVEDFIDIENHFEESSVDGLIAIYSLYFIPREKFEVMLSSFSKVLKARGKFLFVTQIGKGENLITTPLMEENNINDKLYVNYYMKDELERVLNENNFSIKYLASKYDYDEKEISDGGRYIILAENNKMQ